MNISNYSNNAPFTTVNEFSLGMANLNDAFTDPLFAKKKVLPNTNNIRGILDNVNYKEYIYDMEDRTDSLTHYCKYCDKNSSLISQPYPMKKSFDINHFLDNIPQCDSCKKSPIPERPKYVQEIFKRTNYF